MVMIDAMSIKKRELNCVLKHNAHKAFFC